MFIYLAVAEGTTKYKIGFTTKSPNERLVALQTGNSEKLILVKQFATKHSFRLENYLHRKFQSKKVLGEWFDLTEDDVKVFEEVCKVGESNFDCIMSENTYIIDRYKK